jgi:hypothetical protein
MLTQEYVLNRWPRLVAHLICESLGYFTPLAAANAIIAYKNENPFYCEWYCHMANIVLSPNVPYSDSKYIAKLLDINRSIIKSAIKNRKHHKGYMADYGLARKIVEEAKKNKHPLGASWF